MDDVDRFPIYTVAIEPTYCPECGLRLSEREFDDGEYTWCQGCELVFSRAPVSAVHVVVRDGERVLLLDEPVEHHEGVLSLPGGHADHDESPRAAAVRELREETGLAVDPTDLTLVAVFDAETPNVSYHFVTYTLEWSLSDAELVPEADGFETLVLPVEEALDRTQRLRDSDRDRIAAAFDR